MICIMCLEDKNISEFYSFNSDKRKRECKKCIQLVNKESRRKKKSVEIQVLNNKHTQIKVNNKYRITSKSTRLNKKVFIGKLKEIYPDYVLFESESGYMESFHKSAFVDDYIIRQTN